MLVRFIRGTAMGGVGNDANPGDVCDLPLGQARAFVAAGRAVFCETPPPPAPVGALTVAPELLAPEPPTARTRKAK